MWYDLPPQPYRSLIFPHIPPRTIGVEIGVWAGAFSAELLAHVDPAHLTLVDAWTFRTEEPYRDKATYGGKLAKGQSDMDELHRVVLERYGDDPRTTVLRQDSVAAAAAMEPVSIDWVYLDGDHSYDAVKADLAAWSSRVRPGGKILGEDYGEGNEWYGNGPLRAVDEFIAEGGCDVERLGGEEGLFVLRLR